MTHDSDRSRPPWPRAAASCIVFRGDDVLLVERGKGASRGIWSLPGGHIEAGERAQAAAVREVAEETGVTVAIDALVDVHDVLIRSEAGLLEAHYVLAVYRGRHVAGEPCAGSDAAQARFVTPDALSGMRLTPGALRLIAQARNEARSACGGLAGA